MIFDFLLLYLLKFKNEKFHHVQIPHLCKSILLRCPYTHENLIDPEERSTRKVHED